MSIENGILDEIIKAQHNIRKLISDVRLNPRKYSPNMCIYFEQLEEEPNFKYIVNSSPMQLFYDYEKNIRHIVGTIYNPQFSKKQNVLNVLEYIRIMTMYENVKQKYSEDRRIMDLSRYPIFLSVFGKGFCYSQAKFTRDILLHMGINSGDFYIDIYNADNSHNKTGVPHQQTLLQLDNDCFFIDPTDYDGSLDGIQFKVQPQNKEKLEKFGVRTDFSATQEEIKKSRDFVLPKLIKELEIDQISKRLKLEGKGSLQKQCTIMAFVESRLNLTRNLETHMISANLNGVNIEVGKLIELFLYQNNIKYELECRKSNRKNTMYKTEIGGNTVCLCPVLLYSNDINKPGIIIRGTHFVEKDENFILLNSLNAETYQTYIDLIKQGRVDVLQASIKEICRVNHMDIETFMQSPIENMKKYAPEVNIDPIAMKTLVKATQDKVQKNSEEKVTKINTNDGVNYEERKPSSPSPEDFSDGR